MVRLFSDVASRVDDPYLSRAAVLALQGRGATAPNPMVGCVVVRDGRIVGEGYHHRAGEPHAEVLALADAGDAAAGADAYVTLEPCSHQGRTPPCADALIAAGVRRVVIGMADPTELAGGGAHVLRSAGISVDFSQDPAPFMDLNRGWIKRNATGLPFVTVKLAMSLDARLALTPGRRAAITGESGSRVTRWLRGRTDAVMVGARTVAIDDPSLTIRDADGLPAAAQPLRVVLAGKEPLPDTARILTDGAAPTLVLVPGEAAPEALPKSDALGVSVLHYAQGTGLRGALAALASNGVNDVLIEPGPRLFASLWESGVIDEMVVVSAGGMAGEGAPALSEGIDRGADGERAEMDDTLPHIFSPVEAGIVGDVAVTVWRPSDASER